MARGDPRFGVLLDGRYGFEALAEAADLPYWVGRPIELPKSRPLEFEGSADVATELADLAAESCRQVPGLTIIRTMRRTCASDRTGSSLRLFDACRKTRHELLIEIILPGDMPVDAHTVARAISRIYELGVRPDWWKLEPSANPAVWENIEGAIARGDPLCRGVVLLGLSAPETELDRLLRRRGPVQSRQGFRDRSHRLR